MNPAHSAIWIVVPAYNEGRRLSATLVALCSRYDHIVVVDDGSYDDTSPVALQFPVHVLRHPINCGQGAALQTGIDFALGREASIIVTFDGDGQHDPEEIESLVRPIQEGKVDVVLGSRFLGRTVAMPWSRRLILVGGILFTRLFSWIKVTDTHNGLRSLSRKAAQTIRITQNGMAHASQILDQIQVNKLTFCEAAVSVRYNADTLAKGQNAWSAAAIVRDLVFDRLVR